MRLSIVLCKWPKVRPYGNIFGGKYQMVRKVKPWHVEEIEKDIQREKKNIFLCMNPAVSVEQERKLYALMDKEENPEDLQAKMHKAFMENTYMAPIRLSNHYDGLNMRGTWQNYKKDSK